MDGGMQDIPHFGRVRQIVDPDRLTIVNITEPGHLLSPGNVHRSIVQAGDDLYVVTHGYGTGFNPPGNEYVARGVWESTDNNIRSELEPAEQKAPAFRPDASIRLMATSSEIFLL